MSQTNEQHEAIIFIPGVVEELTDQSIEGLAQRLTVAFNHHVVNPKAPFQVETLEPTEVNYQMPGSIPRKTQRLRMTNPDPEKNTTIDIYKLSYNQNLTCIYNNKNFLLQTLRLAVILIYGLPLLFLALFRNRKAKNTPEKLQLLFGILILFLFVGYMGTLLLAVINMPNLQLDPAFVTLPSTIIVLIALLEVFSPQLRYLSRQIIAGYICSFEYLSFGERRNVITGQLTDLLAHLANQGHYQRVHIISYCFGAIIALDNLFPVNRTPTKHFEMIQSLVTIGCPFDIIRLFWQDYFTQRQALPNQPPKWINLYHPADILASNFRDDDQCADAQVGINLTHSEQLIKPDENLPYLEGINITRLNLFRILISLGLRSHLAYWGKTYEGEENCFSIVVKKMYQDDIFFE